MSGRARPGERPTLAGAPIPRALGWSIGVVLVAGVFAVFNVPAPTSSTALRQVSGGGPAGQAGEADLGPSGAPAPAAAPQPLGTSPAAPSSLAPNGSASPAASAGLRRTAVPGTKPATTVAQKAAAAAAPPALQPAPGSYPLSISGTSSVGGASASVPSSGSLVVESRGPDQLHRTVGVPGDLVLVQRATTAGVDLVSFSLTAGSATLSFNPPSPLPFVRTQPGSWSWSVQSSDRTVTLNQTATVTGAGSVSVGGAQVPAVTVQRAFSVSGASISGTVRLTSTVSLVDRLPLVTHQVISVTGRALGGLVSKAVLSDSTATLTSTRPR